MQSNRTRTTPRARRAELRRGTLTAAGLVALVGLIVAGLALDHARTAAGTGRPVASASSATAAAPSPASSASGAPSVHGVVRQVVIPAPRSHFAARPGYVYLPPAALRPGAGAFPVVIALSGQSRTAGPQDVVEPGRIPTIMDRIAASHGGRAPIVVVPDQLGQSSHNPMCVDSALGNVATYITVDVRDWILAHLPVRHDRRYWTIAGFSEGGTCAIQFGAGYPQLFGSLVDVSGQEAPTNGSLAHTIAVGFGGSTAAYERATPLALLKAHAPYPDTEALFTAGGADHHYGRIAPMLSRAAAAAGMHATAKLFPGLTHNWTVATDGYTWSFDRLVSRWGL
ncbi:alpha/beta hydrolase-fold protein [Amnibacterium sp. CER49]|uniref:alpha/beta hydrolase n=1 Tax=Amnibacterium sp. CER49 TaxID=3039161 RepID=UPI0024477DBB|nr:alpha/beta hydrolase-fold protein [Amnibacterium sp. CER49]MDH2445194.1 alpha/beta hydrolase-fold protein [Amnibacterium sp. CER49]